MGQECWLDGTQENRPLLRSSCLERPLQYLREEETICSWHDGAGVLPFNSRALPLGESPQCPRKRMARWRIKPDLFQGLQQCRTFRYFQGNSKDLAVGLRWLWVYLKEESHGCLRIARGELTRRSSSCPRALPILKTPLGAIVWAWPDRREVGWAQPLEGIAEHVLVAHWE